MASRRRQQSPARAALALALPCALIGIAGTMGTAGPAVAADSLATPITAELLQELWPVEVAVEIVAIAAPTDLEPARDPVELLPVRSVTVPDGNRVSFSQGIWTPRGHRDFTVDVVARQHPRERMEIEWDLVVEDAPYQTVSVGDYVLHRLRFGPRPQVGDQQVRISRADIVTTQGDPHVETVEIDGAKYEIRIFALSVRG